MFIFVVRGAVHAGREAGWGFVCLCGSVVCFCASRLLRVGGVCALAHPIPQRVANSFISPPKFCFTPEPVCSLYQKKATIIGPLFRPLIPCGLTMLPWLL